MAIVVRRNSSRISEVQSKPLAILYYSPMRIAVIGGGISGMGAAYLLAPHAQVTLYESEASLGGHANTALIHHEGKEMAVDTGFMVYNPSRYPYFVAMMKELKIESVETTMSFSVSIPGAVEYSSVVEGLVHDLSQLTRPAYLKMLYDIVRFNRAAKRFLRDTNPNKNLLLGDFLARHSYSKQFSEWYLFPMMGSIWSAAPETIRNYGAYDSFRFLDNHLLLNVLNRPEWRTVKGGSREYVSALQKVIEKEGVHIETETVVLSISRNKSGAVVQTNRGEEIFDRVIVATHADTALSLLKDADDEERSALSTFTYSLNTTVLHNDPSFMPRSKRVWASWNFHAIESTKAVSLTYCMNKLQHIPEICPVFVTLNPIRPIKESAVYSTYSYTHPLMNAQAHEGQRALKALQGKNNTYFAGAHLGYGFHEDGLLSAVDVVKALGFPIRLTI